MTAPIRAGSNGGPARGDTETQGPAGAGAPGAGGRRGAPAPCVPAGVWPA